MRLMRAQAMERKRAAAAKAQSKVLEEFRAQAEKRIAAMEAVIAKARSGRGRGGAGYRTEARGADGGGGAGA